MTASLRESRGAVVVRFVIARGGPGGQMADQTITGDFELGDAKPAPLTSRLSTLAV